MFQVDKLHALTWLNPFLAIIFGEASIRPLATKVAALSAGLCLAFSVIALCAHTSSVLRAEASAEKGLANMGVEVRPIDQAVNEALGRIKE
jgi:hypothetical protein